MQLSKNNNINFGALHIATCGNIKLYKAVTPADYNFIKQLPDKNSNASTFKRCTRQMERNDTICI